MNFHRRNKPLGHAHPAIRTTLLLVLALAIVFVVDFASGGALRTFSRVPFSMIEQMRATVFDATRETTQQYDDTDYVRTYITQLENEREAYIYTQLTNALLRAENKALLTQLSGTQAITDPAQHIAKSAHRVLSFSESFPYGTLVVGATDNTVTKGDTVFAGGTLAIGSVESVDTQSLLVRLFSAPKRSVDAFVFANDAAVAVTLHGLGGGNFVTEVPRDVAVVVGSVVSLSASNERALLGIVGAVEANDTDAFKTVRIAVPINLKGLLYVFVAHE